MTEPIRSEQQREHRQRVLKGAAILIDVNTSEIRCTVRNMHSHGAELRVPLGVHIPAEFLLYVPVDGIGYKSVVRWREQDRVGVLFVGTAPKPSWHYG
ncbi:PilZ domain-containing protein [Mesorhizobium sp. BAC0120]|uniref:PilZ domain-containing protein n=1 Tax=Mesorhizobium sp. BAC0120 TaxID=3090670 RepID=UPI00298C09D7|nr:PilZ domain-containing protein [Mesorhizobium sp. BAC0120]MDW6020665.1 PilZ domain-containing protein [Mesorhizobium sp. BAC0120]